MPDIMAMAEAERRELADLLATLTAEQWEAPTLCGRWRVRDVAAHVVGYDRLDARSTAARILKRGSIAGANVEGVRLDAALSTDEILDLYSGDLRPRGLTTMFGGRVALLDTMVHSQDIRRPLGLPRAIPEDRLRAALSFSRFALAVGQPWRTRGLRLVATDLDWHTGFGREVRGPAESLLMAASGRRGSTADLHGPGAEILRRRIERS